MPPTASPPPPRPLGKPCSQRQSRAFEGHQSYIMYRLGVSIFFLVLGPLEAPSSPLRAHNCPRKVIVGLPHLSSLIATWGGSGAKLVTAPVLCSFGRPPPISFSATLGIELCGKQGQSERPTGAGPGRLAPNPWQLGAIPPSPGRGAFVSANRGVIERCFSTVPVQVQIGPGQGRAFKSFSSCSFWLSFQAPGRGSLSSTAQGDVQNPTDAAKGFWR